VGGSGTTLDTTTVVHGSFGISSEIRLTIIGDQLTGNLMLDAGDPAFDVTITATDATFSGSSLWGITAEDVGSTDLFEDFEAHEP